MNDSGSKVFSNIAWRLFERIGAQGVTFVVSLVLAAILDPAVYGSIALVSVFISILQVFVDSGLGNALIQKKDADDLDFSTVFYFNICVCAVLYVLLFIFAPYLALLFKDESLTIVIRVLGVIIIFSGVKNIQQAYVAKNLIFKKFFFATLGGTIGAAVIGISFALLGYGVWALVGQYIFNSFVDTLILWITVKWRPKKMFSFERLKSLFSYGWKLLASALLDVGFKELRTLVIGVKYTKNDLAFYNRGDHFPNLLVTNLNSALDSVLLPVMSSQQDKKDVVRSMTRKAITVSSYVIMPMMVGLAVVAEPLVVLTIGTKWLPCIFFMRVFCFNYSFYAIHTANLNAIKAMGRSDLFLILEIIKKGINLAAIVITMFIGVKAMAIGGLVVSVLCQIINSWPNKKLLDYSYLDQLKDILPYILMSLVMGAAVYSVTFLKLSNILTLLIQIPLGIVIYVGLSKAFHVECYEYVLGIAKGFTKKFKKA